MVEKWLKKCQNSRRALCKYENVGPRLVLLKSRTSFSRCLHGEGPPGTVVRGLGLSHLAEPSARSGSSVSSWLEKSRVEMARVSFRNLGR